jgi:ribosomal protein S18 acetylase RimI-like enzyme
MVRIRVMTEADVPDVSALKVQGWQTAYAGIVPQGYLDAMDEAEDAAKRRESLALSAGRVHNLVAVAEGAEGSNGSDGVSGSADSDGSAVVGWAAYGPYRGEETGSETGELYALYVRPERIGTGVGRALISEVVRQSAELGRRRLALWVLVDNTRARRFYAAAGFAPDGAEAKDLYAGTELREVRYVRALEAG